MAQLESATATFSLEHTDPDWILSRSQGRIPLSNMKAFEVDGTEGTLLFLLQNTKCYNISNLKMNVLKRGIEVFDANDISAVLSALPQFSSTGLTSLYLHTLVSLVNPRDLSRVSVICHSRRVRDFPHRHLLSPLRSQSRLQHPHRFTDEDVLSLCSSLPHIKHLNLCVSPTLLPVHPVPRMTLESLSHCATRCPNLERLELLIDASQPCSNLPAASPSPLRFIQFGECRISYGAAMGTHVAPALVLLFPNLRDL